VASSSKVADILEPMGYQVWSHDGDITRFHLPAKSGANLLDVHFCDACSQAHEGAGSVYHIAFSVSDDARNLECARRLLVWDTR
jgi:glyoxalase family protein